MNQNTLAREMLCFGCDKNDLKEAVDRAVKYTDYHMIAMSMMSDAQEAMERGDIEWARQRLNQAKWVLSTYRVRP